MQVCLWCWIGIVQLQCFHILCEGQRDKIWSSINVMFSFCLSGFGYVYNPPLWPNSCLFFFLCVSLQKRKNFLIKPVNILGQVSRIYYFGKWDKWMNVSTFGGWNTLTLTESICCNYFCIRYLNPLLCYFGFSVWSKIYSINTTRITSPSRQN